LEVALPSDPAELAELSRLLDHALDLAPDELACWLAELPAEVRHLRPKLQEMLSRQGSGTQEAFLVAGPKLDAVENDPSEPRAGELVGPYVLIRELGRGGMGTVWLATRADGALKRQVALKLPRMAWGAGLAGRMARERDIVARLEHPNIARLYDAGVDGLGRPYLALEYIDGETIDAWCRARALSIRDRLALAVQIARAVSYAHGCLVVHRDLKPSNILVTQDGNVHLLDFGIAKFLEAAEGPGGDLTLTQGRLLTPQYASPEQVEGRPVTVASDVYSLGVVLHQLLTDRLPAAAAPAEEPEPASRYASDKATARALRGDVDAIVRKCLAHDPAQRYAGADALAQDIGRHLRGEPVDAQNPGPWYRLSKFVLRHRVSLAAAGLVLAAVVAGTGATFVQWQRAARAAERERLVKDFVAEMFRMDAGTSDDAPREFTAEQLVARGAHLIDSRFPQQPELRAELLGVVGDAYNQLGAYRLAADFEQRQLALLADLKPERAEQVGVMLRAVDSLLKARDTAAARQLTERALAAARGDDLLTYDATVALAQCRRQAGERRQLVATLRQVKAMAQRSAIPNRVSLARALALEAEIVEDDNHWDEAHALFDKAIAVARLAEGRNSLAAVEIQHRLSADLMALNRFDEAIPYEESSLATLREFGAIGQIRALQQHIDIQYMRGQFARDSSLASARVIAEYMGSIERLQIPLPAEDMGRIELKISEMDNMGGNVADALLRVKKIESLFRSTPNRGARFLWHWNAGRAAALAGQHELANDLLRQARALRLETGQGGLQFSVFDAVNVADNLVMEGALQEDEAFLRSLPAFNALEGDPLAGESYAHMIDVSMAQLELARGDADGALRSLGAAGERGPENGSRSPEGDASMIRGIAWCRLGQFERARALFDRAISERIAFAFPQDPGLVWARAQSGLCALREGRRDLALQLASQSRAGLDMQPDVSPYFKAPLLELEKALGRESAATARPAPRVPSAATL
jgi:tetratricopeptide (TPR) repeat protein